MPRWEQGSEDRLQSASIELFASQGFEKTSVVEIAERARVTTRTFFRHFSDKREVLFAAADPLREALVERIRQAPDLSQPLQAVVGILAAFDWESLDTRQLQRLRRAVILANPELLERDLIKTHAMAVEFASALRQRGVEAEAASVAAHVGVQMFSIAYGMWLDDDGAPDLATISKNVMSRLAALAPAGA